MCVASILIALGMAVGIASALEIVRPIRRKDPFYV